jgi:uncharacterized protein (TIGR01777 family)
MCRFHAGHCDPPEACIPGIRFPDKTYSYATKAVVRLQIRDLLRQEGNEMGGRIILGGASGMLGTALRRSLAPEFETLQLVRSQPESHKEIEWNPESTSAFPQVSALEGLTAAIHLSGANLAGKRWTAAYKRELVESRVTTTRALSEALASLRQPPQVLIVGSASGIYGDRGDELLDESSAPGTGFLADLCCAWEEAAAPARQAGIRVVHLRTGVVIGSEGGALAQMLPIFRLGLGGPLGNGRQWMSWIALPDWVAAVHFLLNHESLAGPVNLVAPAPVTNTRFAQALGHAVQRPAILRAPAFALRIAMGEMADEALLASARVMPKRLLDAGFTFRDPTIHEALRAALD